MRSFYTFSRPDSGGAPISVADNTMIWALECIASRALRLRRATVKGGDASSLVLVQRLVTHSAVGTGTRTAIASNRSEPDMAPAPGFGFISQTYGTSPPTNANGVLDPFVYNAQGGQCEFYDEDGIILRGATSLGLHNDTGPGLHVASGWWSEV